MTQIDIQDTWELIRGMTKGKDFIGNTISENVRIEGAWQRTSSNLKIGVDTFLQKGLKFKI